ncbi:MAG: phospholipid carrier-dependent glycosyltransferase [Gemmatimonadetes bacterium]|nr:phospholipid carrier-dependent glycosyltransferase [Gemmatimonadota bacterium]
MSRIERLLLVFVIVVGVLLLFRDVSKPWDGIGGWNGTWVSTAARNHLEYGLGATKGIAVRNDEALPPGEFRYYVHHPAGLPLAVAATYAILGESERSARLFAITCAILTLFLLFLIGKDLGGVSLGLLAAALVACQPLFVLAGAMVNHEAPTGLFILLTVYSIIRWRRDRSRIWGAVSLLSFLIGTQFGWPVYYLGILLPLYAFWVDPTLIRKTIAFPLLAALAFALFIGHTYWAIGDLTIPALKQSFAMRSSGVVELDAAHDWDRIARSGGYGIDATSSETRVTYVDSFIRSTTQLLNLTSLSFLLLALIGLASRPRGVVYGLTAIGLLHLVIFRQGAYEHWYWSYYMLLGLGLAAACGLRFFMRRISEPFARRLLFFFVGVLIVIPAFGKLRFMKTEGRQNLFVHARGLQKIVIENESWPRAVLFGRALDASRIPEGPVLTNLPFLGPQAEHYGRHRILHQDRWRYDDLAAGARESGAKTIALVTRLGTSNDWAEFVDGAPSLGSFGLGRSQVRLFAIDEIPARTIAPPDGPDSGAPEVDSAGETVDDLSR